MAILNNWRDYHILRQQLWYRVPVGSAPRRWPPRWLAFYQTRVFGDEAFSVRTYGRVASIEQVQRRVLFPDEIPNLKSEREYYRVRLQSLEQLAQPIRSARGRRLVFIPTTYQKLQQAREINDLFDDSPLEDRLWARFREMHISAERQWELITQAGAYLLDFAIFCIEGSLDVETAGHRWHSHRQGATRDRARDNALTSSGWRVLRFDSEQINASLEQECLPTVVEMINHLGGLHEAAPPRLYATDTGAAGQLSLFESGPDEDY